MYLWHVCKQNIQRIDLIKILIQAGAAINYVNLKERKMPIMEVPASNTDVKDYLVSMGADTISIVNNR